MGQGLPLTATLSSQEKNGLETQRPKIHTQAISKQGQKQWWVPHKGALIDQAKDTHSGSIIAGPETVVGTTLRGPD